jgi:hypothetical protein
MNNEQHNNNIMFNICLFCFLYLLNFCLFFRQLKRCSSSASSANPANSGNSFRPQPKLVLIVNKVDNDDKPESYPGLVDAYSLGFGEPVI